MKLHIERRDADALMAAHPRLAGLADQLRFGNRVELEFAELADAEIDFLCRQAAGRGPEGEARAAQMRALQTALNAEGQRYSAEYLEPLVPAIARFLGEDAERGWLFTAAITGKPLAWVVTRLDFVPPSEDESGRIMVEIKANAKGKLAVQTITLRGKDVEGKTVSQIFAAKGYLRETPALIAHYDETAHRYFDWRGRYGEQFLGRGVGFYAENPTASHRDTDWARKDLVVLSSSGEAARLVNDESIISDRITALDSSGDILARYLRRANKSVRYSGEDEAAETRDALGDGLFTQLPVHFYILLFHLDLHHYVWVHVDNLQPYPYNPALKQKLILPEEQTDLIDILTAEMDVLMDDIVAGKSGGTTVLCAGPPGVGKTLTAEIYAEIIHRPLYRVHSGQLGLNVAAMETALKDVLTRAQRWGAVMLIDEADVYIKRREDDMTMNAVVGVFLRVLEYFNGLLFLTTNRVDDIDEAIVSRCIALIRFRPPGREDQQRIWQVMAAQFDLALEENFFATLADAFPQATGRDIKGLAKLVAKYCRHKQVAPTLAVFRRCAMFRGMEGAL